MDSTFYNGKKVLVTGHTGFKGAWISQMLLQAGAQVTGVALEPPTHPNLFELAGLEQHMHSIHADIRNYDAIYHIIKEERPEFIIHMAAQPIVLEGYKNPRETFETNVMGTVNILECIRGLDCVKSFLNVTTDKVYLNREQIWGYRETDELNGFDPYSNSKSCSELVTSSYLNSFFQEDGQTMISTARAGNVIGGGDFAADRIIPDCVRAALKGEDIVIRNPYSIRPFQHVLEPLSAYLQIMQKQYENPKMAGNYNVGPDDSDCITTGELVQLFCDSWGDGLKAKIERREHAPHEACFLKLDCTKIKTMLGWKPKWHIQTAIQKTVEFTKGYQQQQDVSKLMEQQISDYMG